MPDNGTETKQLTTDVELTVQSRVKPDAPDSGGLEILPLLVKAGELLPGWWSRARDAELARFAYKCDHTSGALSMFQTKTASVPLKVVPRDMSVKRWVKLADIYNQLLLEGSDFAAGWHASLCPKATWDWLTQDNGIFMEVIGDGKPDGPIKGLPAGLAHLDSQRCQRTSNPEYPVIYTSDNGQRYKLHTTRVIFASSSPSGRARMNSVGFCALSKMVATTQHLIDIATYEQEKLGSRPPRQAIIGEKGISTQQILTAFSMAEESMNSQGLGRYAKTVVIAPKDGGRSTAQEIKLSILDLNSVPDGFSKTESITLGMFLIALALNIPPRWIWPATQAGATKADAMFQHVAGMGGGIGFLLLLYQQLLGGSEKGNITGKFLPPGLKLIFDFQDDEQDRARAELRELRSKNRKEDIAAGVIDIRVAREQALADGDLSEAQFEDLELKEGRLPNGDPVLSLFMSAEPDIQQALALSVGDPLNAQANIGNRDFVLERINDRRLEALAALVNVDKAGDRFRWQQVIAALNELEKLYRAPTEQPEQPEPVDEEMPPEEERPEEEPNTETEEGENEPVRSS